MPPSGAWVQSCVIRPAFLISSHVGSERQRDDVGLEPVHDVLRLGGAAAVGLLEDDRLVVVLSFHMRLEGRDDLAVDLARRAVRGERDDRGSSPACTGREAFVFALLVPHAAARTATPAATARSLIA